MLLEAEVVNEVVGMTELLLDSFAGNKRVWTNVAHIYATLVSELEVAGFSREEALRIACAYGIPVNKVGG